jgi:hypothetical protein
VISHLLAEKPSDYQLTAAINYLEDQAGDNSLAVIHDGLVAELTQRRSTPEYRAAALEYQRTQAVLGFMMFAPMAPMVAEAAPAAGVARFVAGNELRRNGTTIVAGAAVIATAAKVINDESYLRSCKTIGTWETDPGYAGRGPNTRAYQDFISGHKGQHFRVIDILHPSGKIDYDACFDTPTGPKLGEAKADHRTLLTKYVDEQWFGSGRASLLQQARRQSETATRLGVPLEWSVQMRGDHAVLSQILLDAGFKFPVKYAPLAVVK